MKNMLLKTNKGAALEPQSYIPIIKTILVWLKQMIKDIVKEAIREELPQNKVNSDTEVKLYDKEEAAEFLRISVSTLDNHRRKKRFGKKLGNRVVFRQEELMALLEDMH